MAKEKTQPTFEELYAQLEERVGKLEQGGLSLEEAVALYEEGMNLARQCQQRLDTAELKITRLKESFAAVETEPAVVGAEDDHGEIEYVADEEPPDEDDPFA